MKNNSAPLFVLLLARLAGPLAVADSFKPVQNLDLDYVFVREGARFDNDDAVMIEPINGGFRADEHACDLVFFICKYSHTF